VASLYSPGGSAGRSVWRADVQDEVRNGSIYDDPLGQINADWAKTMLELPNGLYAFAVSAADLRLSQSPRECSTCSSLLSINAIACMGCHATGPLPVEDIMRELMEVYGPSVGFDAAQSAELAAVYPPVAEFAELVRADSVEYVSALERAGVLSGLPDPVSRVYLGFDEPLGLERAAAELGVPAATLANGLGALPAALAPLGAPLGTVERTAFGAAFVEALCALGQGGRNHPAACP
jgi:hypothetical protein